MFACLPLHPGVFVVVGCSLYPWDSILRPDQWAFYHLSCIFTILLESFLKTLWLFFKSQSTCEKSIRLSLVVRQPPKALRSRHSREAPGETWLSAVWNPGYDPVRETGHEGKLRKSEQCEDVG